MIFISLLILIVAIALPSLKKQFSPILFTRIVSIVFIYAGALSLNALYIQSIGSGIGIYSGLFHVTAVSQLLDTFIFTIASIILISWPSLRVIITRKTSVENEIGNIATANLSLANVSLIVLFSTIGASLLISSAYLIFMYLFKLLTSTLIVDTTDWFMRRAEPAVGIICSNLPPINKPTANKNKDKLNIRDYFNKKNIILGFNQAYKVSLLPLPVELFLNNIFIRIIRFICSLCLILVLTNQFTFLPQYLHGLIIVLAFIQSIQMLIIFIIKIVYGLYTIICRRDKLEVKN